MVVGQVYAIYVDPTYWRVGIGRRLMERALAELRAAGLSDTTLWVRESNRRARRFYTACGWQPDGSAKETRIGGDSAAVTIAELRYRRCGEDTTS